MVLKPSVKRIGHELGPERPKRRKGTSENGVLKPNKFGRECPEAAASESDPNDRLENALPSVVPSEDEMVLVLVFAFIFFAEVTLAGDTAASDESLGSESTES